MGNLTFTLFKLFAAAPEFLSNREWVYGVERAHRYIRPHLDIVR